MTEQPGLKHQLTVHWGQAIIGGLFGLAIAAIGAGALYVRVQPTAEREERELDETRQALRRLENRLSVAEQESRQKEDALAAALTEVQRLRIQVATRMTPAAITESPIAPTTQTPPPSIKVERLQKGDFSFELRGCRRRGDDVRCSLAVINDASERKSMNLCGASYMTDESGQKPQTRIAFAGGGCGSFQLDPGLPSALEMSAEMPGTRSVSIVLSDGNWFSFPGSAIFRGIVIDTAP